VKLARRRKRRGGGRVWHVGELRVRVLSLLAVLMGLLAPSHGRAADLEQVSAATLEHELDDLENPLPEARRRAADSVMSIGPGGLAGIRQWLAEMRKAGIDPGVAAVLREVSPTAGAAAKEDALALALLDVEPSGVSYRTALATACLLAALARVGTTEAVREMVAVSRDQGGAWRPEVTRQIERLGDRATAALILAASDPARDLARWATSELETLGRKVPGDAVQTKSNQVLSDVLGAYGTTRDMDALSAVLSFVNSDRPQIRDAARRAILAYGDLALPKLREAYASLSGGAPPETWSAMEVSRELFSQDDRLRLQDVYALMDEGLEDEARGQHDKAVEAFERVLARQPLFERRAEMVPAYVLYARSKEDDDRPSAEGYYRIARRLSPDGPRASQVTSALDFLEGEDLLDRGICDLDLFRRAADEDPGNAKAHHQLALLDADRERRERTLRDYAEGCGAAAIVAAGVVLGIGRRSRRRKRRGNG
jgi:tetratricopeptide (TPR) repeat protein